MGGGTKDTMDAWQRQQQRDGFAMRNGRNGRRHTMSNGRGDTKIKKMYGKKWTIKKRWAGARDGVRIEMIAGDQRMMAIVGGELVISILCRMVI